MQVLYTLLAYIHTWGSFRVLMQVLYKLLAIMFHLRGVLEF